jgi:TolA-binding protein
LTSFKKSELMKTNYLYGTLLLACLTVISCKKEEEAVTTVDPNKQIIMPRVAPIPTGNTAVQQPQLTQPTQTITPEQMQQMQMQQQMQLQQQNANKQVVATKPGMNPPHGQPGHQCGIPVGAPLNSKTNASAPNIGSATTQQMSITPPAQNGAATATPALLNPDSAGTVTEPGMNPPHGQPGHQCGIPVGSPLPK